VFCYAGAGVNWDVAEALSPLGSRAASYTELDALVADAVGAAQPGDCLLVMSNGGFGGIHGKLLAALAAPRAAA
jgi:UDP-N-acetylmuramate: L-alanyl-gamma-D-glutamyl-meso-diaminopimelate ligase